MKQQERNEWIIRVEKLIKLAEANRALKIWRILYPNVYTPHARVKKKVLRVEKKKKTLDLCSYSKFLHRDNLELYA